MNHHLRLLLILSAIFLTVGCSVGRPADDARGEEIYVQLCSRCHGDDLEGGIGPPLGAGSPSAEADDEYLRFTVENGRGRMPSFSSSLDDDQLERLIEYMREVQGE